MVYDKTKFQKILLSFKSIFCCILSYQYTFALRTEYFHRDYNLGNIVIKSASVNTQYPQFKKVPDKNLKYILMWTAAVPFNPFSAYTTGHKQFVDQNCSVNNCFVTGNKMFFGGDLTKFDVIAFNGIVTHKLGKHDLPKARTARQKYVYGNAESSDNFPIKQPFFEDYFNWTFTYRFDSDFVCPYFTIRNKRGEIIGPKNNMEWDELDEEMPQWLSNNSNIEIITKNNKKKAVAWFVSNCDTLGGREIFAEKLNRALRKYNLNVDIYGKCGDLKCYGFMSKDCNELLKRDYFFYLALENSLAIDYVTEKVVVAFNNDVVPIVYGGADYSKFVPPNSYIDGRKMKVTEIAEKIYTLMNNLPEYLKYFRWKKYYTYELYNHNLCKFCEAINDESKFTAYSSYKAIRNWWNNNYYSKV